MFRNNDISDGGRPVRITAPDYNATPIVSLAELKSSIGIIRSDQDALLTEAINAVVANLDPYSEGWLGRAIGAQTWELQLQSFDDRRLALRPYYNVLAIPLPYPPLISVVSVKYLDVNGVDTTMILGTDYRVLGSGERIQAIAPLYAKTWPVARRDVGSVRIRFSCGYDGQNNKTPAQLSAAICLGVRALLPLLSRDPMLFEDRVEGLGYKRYQNNPAFAKVIEDAIAGLLANLRID